MNTEEALSALDLVDVPPADDLDELITEQVFALREYFLRNPVVPELYRGRMRRLHRITEAGFALGWSCTKATRPFPAISFGEQAELTNLLRGYELALSQVRSEMAKTLNPIVLGALAVRMVEVQLAFEVAFFAVTTEVEPADAEPKAADQADSGRMLWLLADGEDEQAQSELRGLIARERKRIMARHARDGRQ
jgi:hypothetical protein